MEATETTLVVPSKKECRHWYVEWQENDSAHYHGVERQIFHGESPYQVIDIYQTKKFGKLLVLDGDPQSSEHDEDIYHEALVHPALVTHPNPRAILILGGGEGATLREALRHPQIEKIVMVDIDATVVDVCKKELPAYSNGAYDNPKVRLLIDDANKYLKETNEKFDCVISDLTEPFPESPTHGLLTKEFFTLVKSRMSADGVLAMQASHAGRGMNRLYLHHLQTLKGIWKTIRPYRAFIPAFYSEWGYILASDAHDPLVSTWQKIDEKLKPFASQLRYYDGRIHHAIFTPPKELRPLL